MLSNQIAVEVKLVAHPVGFVSLLPASRRKQLLKRLPSIKIDF
jgi:hypothetical protein